MDWNETDPQNLRLITLETPPTALPVSVGGREQTFPAPPAVDANGSAEQNAFGTNRTDIPGRFSVEAVPVPQAPQVFSGNMMSAATADIWQRLSFLVRSPARMNGIWPLLIPLASMGLLISLVMGSGWFALAWGLALAAGIKVTTAHAQGEYARDAINMAPFDLRWVGPLAQALNSPHPRVRGVAARILTHLLPHLRPQDAHLLTPQQRSYLNQRLFRNRRSDSDLNCAILAAWATVGDAEAAHYVERASRARGWSVGQQQVRQAARACLPHLEQRLELERADQLTRAQVAPTETLANAPLSLASQQAIAEVDSELAKLREEQRKHSNPGMRLGFLIASWVFIVPFTAFQTWLSVVKLGSWKLGLAWAVLTLLATQLHRFALSSKQSEAARKLAAMEDIRAVGPLAEALDWPDASIKQAASDGLKRLLPRLTASDANLLNAKQRGILYGMLRMRNVHANVGLIAAILKALQQVGDEAAVPVVERLFEARAYGKNQNYIKQLAGDTLPLLSATARNTTASAIYLRASSGHDTPSDLLLRGAMATPEEPPQQLLRASASEETAC